MAHVPGLWAETHSWQLLSKLKMHFCRLSRAMRLMCSNMFTRALPSEARCCHLAWAEKRAELRLGTASLEPRQTPNHLRGLPQTQLLGPLPQALLPGEEQA